MSEYHPNSCHHMRILCTTLTFSSTMCTPTFLWSIDHTSSVNGRRIALPFPLFFSRLSSRALDVCQMSQRKARSGWLWQAVGYLPAICARRLADRIRTRGLLLGHTAPEYLASLVGFDEGKGIRAQAWLLLPILDDLQNDGVHGQRPGIARTLWNSCRGQTLWLQPG